MPAADSAVRSYVDEALTILDEGLYTGTPEWEAARDAARAELYGAATVSATYDGIRGLGTIAGGDHTFFLTPAEAADTAKQYDPDAGFDVPTVATAEGVSTITVPSFAGQEQSAIDRYQDAGLGALRSAVPSTTCGWIIDLRANGGGNAYPMLSSVAPLLDDGHVVGFRNREGDTSWIDVRNGGLVPTGDAPTPATADVVVDQPVALVIGPGSASAAETVAIAFAGQTDTVRVGGHSAGLTTANEPRTLSDGAVIALTVATTVDRTGAVQAGPLTPDIPRSTSSDAALDAAADWVRGRC